MYLWPYILVPPFHEVKFCGVPSCVFEKLVCAAGEKRLQNTDLFKTVSREKESVNLETFDEWTGKPEEELHEFELQYVYSADETDCCCCFFLSFLLLLLLLLLLLPPPPNIFCEGEPSHGGRRPNDKIILFLICSAEGSDKLSPLLILKYQIPHCFKNMKTEPAKYLFNSNAWIPADIFTNKLHPRGGGGGDNKKYCSPRETFCLIVQQSDYV
jgi:hypothetical protein